MRPLRIALVHSFYRSAQPSGENEVVRDQAAALAAAGHEVRLVAEHSDRRAGARLYPLQAAVTVASGRGPSPVAELREFRPDVVHVHNLFPNFGTSWLRAWTGPLVATLHNFRPLCAGAGLHRDGRDCTLCPDGDRWAGLRHACYRGSRAATLPLSLAGRHGAAGHPLLARADRLVVLSEPSRRMYVRAGVDEQRLAVMPNFVPEVQGSGRGDGPWLYAGRLSAEKGIVELLRAWPKTVPLDVAGSGELEAECRALAPGSVRFLGALDRDELRRRLPHWRGLVFPSTCREGGPTVYLEALAAGLPVLALEGSSVPEAVRADGTGWVASWERPLRPVLEQAERELPGLRTHCKAVFARRYGETRWLREVREVYAAAGSR
ncbi:glycosyltransferase family 4 protein [Streptomyces boninensis]|uniref:glycosyltransferase family 4 protein n=1 Tax=Streptomyces boninensis TaxID=2039455 RepID=UPI003B218A13